MAPPPGACCSRHWSSPSPTHSTPRPPPPHHHPPTVPIDAMAIAAMAIAAPSSPRLGLGRGVQRGRQQRGVDQRVLLHQRGRRGPQPGGVGAPEAPALGRPLPVALAVHQRGRGGDVRRAVLGGEGPGGGPDGGGAGRRRLQGGVPQRAAVQGDVEPPREGVRPPHGLLCEPLPEVADVAHVHHVHPQPPPVPGLPVRRQRRAAQILVVQPRAVLQRDLLQGRACPGHVSQQRERQRHKPQGEAAQGGAAPQEVEERAAALVGGEVEPRAALRQQLQGAQRGHRQRLHRGPPELHARELQVLQPAAPPQHARHLGLLDPLGHLRVIHQRQAELAQAWAVAPEALHHGAQVPALRHRPVQVP
mmetsp:Transcript_30261/g.84562  ORF Transcript_30261/g.84562 Transcript_30261/m.84562 type:complete len:361 (+) Transcript_30261:62-1144(+)